MSTALSVCVLARDEVRELRRCLESTRWAEDRVVVVDSRARPETAETARALGARVIVHPYAGNIEQKNVALAQAKHDWVLALDADEAVTPALAQEIRGLSSEDRERYAGYEINRVTHHLGHWLRHGDFFPDWQLRLFRRSRGEWAGINPHGRVRLEGRVGRLRGELEHTSYRDLADQVTRIQSFSVIQARELHRRGRRARRRDLWLRPPARFLRAYVLKQGYRDGVPGFVVAAATAFHVFLKYATLWELQNGTSRATLPSPHDDRAS